MTSAPGTGRLVSGVAWLARARPVLLVTCALTVAALGQIALAARRGALAGETLAWSAVLAVGGLAALGQAGWLLRDLVRRPAGRRGPAAVTGATRLGWVRYPLGLALLVAFPALVMGPAAAYLQGFFSRVLVFWLLALAAAWVLVSLRREWSWETSLLVSALAMGIVHRAAAFLPDISAYPFALGWSETSRYYYASLFLSERVYGVAAAPPIQHPARYLMQSLPFLLPQAPLWVHRAWQVALWIGVAGGTAWIAARRTSPRDRQLAWLLAAWAFLFFFQGPVYYHLLVPIALIMWGFSSAKPWRSLALVVAASLWTGISRLNWYPVPALLAASLYLIETRRASRPLVSYYAWPVVWVAAGTLAALASQAAYVALSGVEADRFSSSLISQLLWYRLFPNPTYPAGVLPAVAFASLPVLVVLARRWARLRASMGTSRMLPLAGVLLLLLAGGLVVSVKIGGGSNLHNLDAYLVLLASMGAGAYAGSVSAEASRRTNQPPGSIPLERWLAVAIPLVFAIPAGHPWLRYDAGEAGRSLDQIRSMVEARGDERPILFVSQRHLLTFAMVPGIPLEPRHELVFLMEMAMSGHRAYLDGFHRELRDREYSLIVVEPLKTNLQGRARPFGEENDAWVQEVSIPILCYYEPGETLETPPLQLLVPRAESCECLE